jgi:drug/metabolite transporter (DMT)-like permease
MSDFLQRFLPPNFWIFVVLAALVLHVVANYLQRQISDWIEGNGDRAALALVEANFFCILGFLLLLNAFVGFVAVLVTRPSRPFLNPILEALFLAMICLLGFLCMATGSRIRGVLLRHPKGLSGLHRGNAPRPHL